MELPQEIVDAIIVYVAISPKALARSRGVHREPPVPDKNALKACALTSRSFLPRSQKHLFASVICVADAVPNFDRLLSRSPHLGSYVECFASTPLYLSISSHEYCICCLTWTTSRRRLTGTPGANQPPLLSTVFQSVLPSRLRILYLSDSVFSDAAELSSPCSCTPPA
jgi:hypothetical protein